MRSRAASACLILLAIATLAPRAADAGGPLRQATARARQRIAGEQAAYGKATLVPETRSMRGMGKTRRVFRAQIAETGQSVFARLPRYGVEGAMRRHNFMRIIADQIGKPGLVPLAATIELADNIGDGSINIDGL